MKNDVLKEKSFLLACEVIDINDKLININKKSIADQLLRCGTSIGANIRESIYSESKKDLIHKLSISLKESEECKFWFELIEAKTTIKISDKAKDYLDHLQRVMIIIIKSSRS
jgi:four helix bundle protein